MQLGDRDFICKNNKLQLPTKLLSYETACHKQCYHAYSLRKGLASLSYHQINSENPELIHLSWAVTTSRLVRYEDITKKAFGKFVYSREVHHFTILCVCACVAGVR
jgi:hypothetical protein